MTTLGCFVLGDDPVSRRYNAASLSLLFVVVLLMSWSRYHDRRLGPPAEVFEYRLTTARVPVGGLLGTEAVIAQWRDCPVDVERLAREEATGNLLQFPGAGDGAFSLGLSDETAPRRGRVRVPTAWAPGKYAYRAAASYDCEDGQYILRTPWLPFEVVP